MKYAAPLAIMWTTAVLGGATPGVAAEKPPALAEAAQWMPDSAVVYLELSRPGQLLELADRPAVQELLKRSPEARAYFESDNYQQLLSVVEVVERRLGVKWRPAVRDVLGGGVSLAVDPLARTGLLVVKARNATTLAKLHEVMVELIETDAENNGRPSPIKSKEYNGVKGWTFGKNEYHAILGQWLVASNRAETLMAAVDRYRGEKTRSLAKTTSFQQARAAKPADCAGWGMARLSAVWLIPGLRDGLANATKKNPAAELLAGGVMESLSGAPFVGFSLHMDDDQLRIAAQLPHDTEKISKNRRWYFASETGKSAHAPLRPKGMIANITSYRDLSGMWLAREELFNEEIVARLSQVDSGLGLYFSGRDFGTQVLGALTPRSRFVVARQDFANSKITPAMKLPAFAWVLEMKDPADFGPQLLLSYQKIIGLGNIIGGMNGQPQMLMETEQHAGVKITKATPMPLPNMDRKAAKLNYNFSPSCATVGNFFILCSTTQLTRDLIDELKKPEAAKTTTDNSRIELDAGQLAAVLNDNREALISQNMLEEGHTREEAAKQIGALLDALRLARKGHFRLGNEKGRLTMEWAVGIPKEK